MHTHRKQRREVLVDEALPGVRLLLEAPLQHADLIGNILIIVVIVVKMIVIIIIVVVIMIILIIGAEIVFASSHVFHRRQTT